MRLIMSSLVGFKWYLAVVAIKRKTKVPSLHTSKKRNKGDGKPENGLSARNSSQLACLLASSDSLFSFTMKALRSDILFSEGSPLNVTSCKFSTKYL